MSKNGGKSANPLHYTAETDVFISGKFAVSSLAGKAEIKMVELSGFEPLTPCLQSRCSTS
jgi:hypothetical protein